MGAAEWRPSVPTATTGRPAAAEGVIARPAVVERLGQGVDGSTVVVVAPAGYGKSTAVALWDQSDRRPFAWLRIDHLNDDPAHLVLHIAAALDRVRPVDPRILDYLRGPGRGPLTQLLPALLEALQRCGPVVVVFDDVDGLDNDESIAVLRAFVRQAPPQLTSVFVGRRPPPLDLARTRLERRLSEVGAQDLRFTAEETLAVFPRLSHSDDPAAALAVHTVCEGWPAGVVLAALAVRDGADAATVTGRHRLVTAYLVENVLVQLDPETAGFLQDSAVLDRFCAADLDAVLDREDSARMLAAIVASGNPFLVSLDPEGVWYRYHGLFRDVLSSRLREQQPARFRMLASRAADLRQRQGDIDGALLSALAAEDRQRAAALLGSEAVRLGFDGRAGVLARRIGLLDDGVFAAYPDAAIARAWLGVTTGDAQLIQQSVLMACRADRGAPMSDGTPSVPVAVALVNSVVGVGGVREVARSAQIVRAAGGHLGNPWWGAATVMYGAAISMMGEPERARRLLESALPVVDDLPGFHGAALAHLALLDLIAGDEPHAAERGAKARQIVDDADLCDVVPMIVVYAVSAVTSARAGHLDTARAALRSTQRLLDRLGNLAARTALLGHALAAWAAALLGEATDLSRHLDAADRARHREPDARMLSRLLDQVRTQSTGKPVAHLTSAELRLLPHLASHRSLQGIADDLAVSRETVKSQVTSIYRKLEVSGRSAAVAESKRIGLLRG
ncbi:helix-turn-helix transcriptional regulator [Mycolicibacterium brumae]|uniref:LuxR family transcriptional regulator n=1 Tax=Mycolicibacterium brumae TaxID=85968 RepID=A0A2G5PGY9_9MYCO|nr:AAA family ATPase [Mycolicibacterium brumae]MCV7192605.1 LuxR family transcriptional regulator [Mycolicibacterium brumae]PIB77410.1 LuxR family transcriptional regulator [Mycolicibacterium brumae]RWA18403.1 hypothetical protein MBRU_04095 [Mycolicibacterium brumae DSM 44177]UWW10375.1 LuxR C-terminal-related transcriptional regulator [Mycolicibacterium brumae]